MGDAYPRAPQRRSDYEDGAAGLAPRTRLFVTRSPVGGNKIARIATRGLFNLIRRPRTAWFGQTMLDPGLLAGPVERMPTVDAWLVALGPVGGGCSFGLLVRRRVVGELEGVVGQHRVDRVGHGCDQITKKVRCNPLSGPVVQLNEGELARAVGGHEQVQLALFRADLCDVDVELSDRIGLEARTLGFVAIHVGQPADAVALKAAVQRRAGQVRKGGLERVKAIVQRQKSMLPEGHDDGLLLRAQDGGPRFLRSHAGVH